MWAERYLQQEEEEEKRKWEEFLEEFEEEKSWGREDNRLRLAVGIEGGQPSGH